MFDGVQAKAVAPRGGQSPHHGADRIGVHIFRNGDSVAAVERTPRTSEQWTRGIHVILGIGWLPDERDFWNGAAQRISEVAVDASRFGRQIDEPAERLILDVELIIVILHAGPISIKTAADRLQMKIL